MRWDTHHTEKNSRILHIYRKGWPDLANENWASSLLLFFSISCFRNRYSASEIIMFVKNVSHWSVALIKICIYTRHISQLYCSLAEEWLLLESVGGWANRAWADLSWPGTSPVSHNNMFHIMDFTLPEIILCVKFLYSTISPLFRGIKVNETFCSLFLLEEKFPSHIKYKPDWQ